MYFKKLIGTKCYLSPIDTGDSPQYAEWLNDLEVLQGLQLYPNILNLEAENEALQELSQEHNYAIINLGTNELLGNCGFLDISHLNQTAEVGIFIGNKDYWNKGYGTEALRLLVDYGFKALNLHNIQLRVYSENKRAMRCYEKVGFKTLGFRREAIYRNLKRQDLIYMDLIVSDFYRD
jgi:RimJ/RimL family protein N-acetyltransferase